MPLEGLWWAEDMDTFTSARDKSRWSWTMMVMVPDWITAAMFTGAVEQVARKDRPARLDDLRLDVLSEGCCVQALHVGSYDDEAELLRRMHEEFIPAHGLRMVGRHHEIYLSDARRGGAGPVTARSIHSTANAHTAGASTSTLPAAPTGPRTPRPVARKSDTIVAK
jgi:hypothetical protein